MLRARVLACLLVLPVLGTCIAVAPPAAAASHHAALRFCSKSATPRPTRFNRTPPGSGPWQVPFDRCNYEGRAMHDTSTPYGDCVYWPAEKRPDVFYGPVNRYGYRQSPYGAWNVAIDARKGGYRVDHTPRAGDIAAWKSNALMGQDPADGSWYTAAPGGHISYVESVSGSVITISDMGHDPADGGYTFPLTYTSATYFIHRRHR
ncbi:MAG: CHAP domain-containing protein [Mycobacteriales bacterium]